MTKGGAGEYGEPTSYKCGSILLSRSSRVLTGRRYFRLMRRTRCGESRRANRGRPIHHRWYGRAGIYDGDTLLGASGAALGPERLRFRVLSVVGGQILGFLPVAIRVTFTALPMTSAGRFSSLGPRGIHMSFASTPKRNSVQ